VTGEAFGFHDFRHFRITFLATSEVARWISEAWVGHKRKNTVETQRPTSFY
jgi:integrase